MRFLIADKAFFDRLSVFKGKKGDYLRYVGFTILTGIINVLKKLFYEVGINGSTKVLLNEYAILTI
jgi:hypothetical protein